MTPKIGILGTGIVGQTFAKRLSGLGHEVFVGARSADSESLKPFEGIDHVSGGSFSDAAKSGEFLINATNGVFAIDALSAAGAENLAGKVLLDVSNALDHSGPRPRSLASPGNSLGARIQSEFPEAKVVKSLNTMNCSIMVEPSLVPGGEHTAFIAGNDDQAKAAVRDLLLEFGWGESQLLDLGGIETASSTEMMMGIWIDVMIARGGFGAGPYNFAIISG